MDKHTPGPWRVDSHFNIFYKDAMVAFPCISGGLDQKANARLIAAAPELLEALENLLKAVEWTETKPVHHLTSLGRGMAKAKIAIAKATGEQK
jgi:hypothetical protein